MVFSLHWLKPACGVLSYPHLLAEIRLQRVSATLLIHGLEPADKKRGFCQRAFSPTTG
jgi:hypothetical protein